MPVRNSHTSVQHTGQHSLLVPCHGRGQGRRQQKLRIWQAWRQVCRSQELYPVLAVERPQRSHLPFLDVARTPVVQEDEPKDVVCDLLNAYCCAYLIPRPDEGSLGHKAQENFVHQIIVLEAVVSASLWGSCMEGVAMTILGCAIGHTISSSKSRTWQGFRTGCLPCMPSSKICPLRCSMY